MGPPNPKNLGLSAAGMDLGLGDILRQQLDDQTEELRKKRQAMQPQQALFGAASLSLLGPGTQADGAAGPYGAK